MCVCARWSNSLRSQSLWSRDGFLIQNPSKKPPMSGRRGRNPFGAGTVFQLIFPNGVPSLPSRNPFGAGTVFQFPVMFQLFAFAKSQSLWSRDGFSILLVRGDGGLISVAIPLEQGRFFNAPVRRHRRPACVAIPLEQGRFFNKYM